MSSFDPSCVFCKIVSREMPAVIVYESADAMAFLDAHPITAGHVLVIPKRHYRNLFDFGESDGASLMRAERIVAVALRAALGADGLTVFQSNERAGGQSVYHFHAHLIPRFLGDGLIKRPEQLARSGGGVKLPEVAEKIRANLVED